MNYFSRLKMRRDILILAIIFLTALAVLGRAFYIQIYQHHFLASEGNKRQIREMSIPAPRGEIFDRNGELLALSTPVVDVCVDPKYFNRHLDRLPELAKALGISSESLHLKVMAYQDKRFMYVKRQVLPNTAKKLAKLDIPGLFLEEKYKRYYPSGEILAHVVGYTNIDDQGQDGIEYTYNDWLKGVPGKKMVIKDRAGHVVKFVKDLQPAKPGHEITLSIDKDIQYFTYRALKKALIQHQAKSASAVVLNAKTGEILAMVNVPSFNPNDRSQIAGTGLLNRAITDLMEPGSTVKPFIIAKALDAGVIDEHTKIQTAPGYIKIADRVISDTRNHGLLTPAGIIKHSSNIGALKVALKMTPEQIWHFYHALGFCQDSGLFLPGESMGFMKTWQDWSKVYQAAVSYGYGFDINLLQLAHAYLLFTNKGAIMPLSILKKQPNQATDHHQLISPEVAQKVLEMMETVTEKGGTAPKAAIPGYRVAGKTGTVYWNKAGRYEKNTYRALFSGIVPVSNPQFIMTVVVNQPSRGIYYGGQVAAPIFKEVMQEVLRLKHIPYDAQTKNRDGKGDDDDPSSDLKE